MSVQAKITSRDLIHDGFLKVERLSIEENGRTFTREFISKKEAVVVLVVNADNDSIILTRQFRPVGSYSTECVAGIVENGKTLTETAISEVLEEVGYKITEDNLHTTNLNGYVSGGFTDETYTCFIAEVSNDMKVNDGGGLDNENEFIEVIEISTHDFITEDSQFYDFKTNALRTYLKGIILTNHIEELQAQLTNNNGGIDISSFSPEELEEMFGGMIMEDDSEPNDESK